MFAYCKAIVKNTAFQNVFQHREFLPLEKDYTLS